MCAEPAQMLAHYRLTDKIGEGGMGVVYQAEDVTLRRPVALKFLTGDTYDDEHLRARFLREARTAAALNHPSICTIHEVGEIQPGEERSIGENTRLQAGMPFIAMELIQGRTLQAVLAQSGPLKIDRLLALAVQIAEGLAAAHTNGIVHRDLKPGNVMVKPDSRIKILDFGLARPVIPPDEEDAVMTAAETVSARLTQKGMVLGTVAYMSPEQASGRKVDTRSDVFSFGIMLFEMAAGKRPFEGESPTSTLAKILESDPEPIEEMRSDLPRELARIVRRCLRKNPDERFHDTRDLLAALEDLREETLSAAGRGAAEHPAGIFGRQAAHTSALSRWRVSWPVALLMGIIAFFTGALGTWRLVRTPPAGPRQVTVVPVGFPKSVQPDYGRNFALSPDGKRLVFRGISGAASKLFLRDLDRIGSRVVPDSVGASRPFFSPDGRCIGFFAARQLKRWCIDGGSPVALCEAPQAGGGHWCSDGTIFFASRPSAGIWRISADGGDPVQVTKPDRDRGETMHLWPHVLPGEKAVLFTVWSTSLADARVDLLLPESGERRILIAGGAEARYAPTGHLLYVRSGTLMAAPFDLERLEVGEPHVSVIEHIAQSVSNAGSPYSFSQRGLMVYVRGGELAARRSLVWGDRQGRLDPLSLPPGAYSEPRVAPDGQSLAFSKFERGASNIWVLEFATGTTRQLTFENNNSSPVWAPDGSMLAFYDQSKGVCWMPPDRSRPADCIVPGRPSSFSPDGKTLLYTEWTPGSGIDVWSVSLDAADDPQPVLQDPWYDSHATFHPSGEWFAYTSDQSGSIEIYVKPFPGPGAITTISVDGGCRPLWSRDGRELFYVNESDDLMVVDVRTEPRFSAGAPRLLLKGQGLVMDAHASPDVDVTTDGRFVLVREEPDAVQTGMILMHDWFDALEALVPGSD